MAAKKKPAAKPKTVTKVGGWGHVPAEPWKPRPFTPYKAPDSPPPGMYDPALDSQGRASQRGLGQTIDDLTTAGSRASTGLELDKDSLNRQAGRSLADILTGRTRLTEDRATAMGDVSRSFQRLGSGQRQSAAAAGISGGGALAAAMKARQGNQQLAERPIAESFQRGMADLGTRETRVADDQALGNADLERQFGYGVADRVKAGQRATDENTIYQSDVGAQRFWQASQNPAYVPSQAPSNEFRSKGGTVYRTVKRKGGKVGYLQSDGSFWSRRPR